MTIASFCRDELLAHGPLTLDDLAARAVTAGVTRAANPTSTVRQAIQYDELERWQPYAHREPGGLVALRITDQQAELLQRIARALYDELPDPLAEERWLPSVTDRLRLLP